MTKRVKVLLATGHLQLAETIGHFLEDESAIELLGICEDGEQLRTFLSHNAEQPDVLLMDATMDERAEYCLSRWVAIDKPEVRVLLMTDRHDRQMLDRKTSSNIQHFINKTTTVQALIEKLLSVAKEKIVYTRSVPMYMMDIGSDFSVPVPAARSKDLPKRESEVLSLILNQHSSREIMEKMTLEREGLEEALTNLREMTNTSGKLGLRSYAIRHRNF